MEDYLMKKRLLTMTISLMLLVVMAMSRGMATAANAPVTLSDDAARRDYIASCGYTPAAADAEVREVVLPTDFDETLTQYDALQQQAGFDFAAYRGKRVKCYTYTVTNIPDTAAVAHLYVYNDKVIGGDISSISADGFCRPLVPQTTA